jgi:hypothetical protein
MWSIFVKFSRILISFPTSYAPARFYKTRQPRGKHKGEKREGIILAAERKLSLCRRCRMLFFALFLLRSLFLCWKSTVVTLPTTDIMRHDESSPFFVQHQTVNTYHNISFWKTLWLWVVWQEVINKNNIAMLIASLLQLPHFSCFFEIMKADVNVGWL